MVSIYRCCAIADEAMSKEGAVKLAAFRASEKTIGPEDRLAARSALRKLRLS
jgi:hypothetical protein